MHRHELACAWFELLHARIIHVLGIQSATMEALLNHLPRVDAEPHCSPEAEHRLRGSLLTLCIARLETAHALRVELLPMGLGKQAHPLAEVFHVAFLRAQASAPGSKVGNVDHGEAATGLVPEDVRWLEVAMLQPASVVDTPKEEAEGLEVAHQLGDLPALHFSENDIREALSARLMHDNQIVRVLSSRTLATKDLQREGQISIVNEVWILLRKFQEALGLRRDRWMVPLGADELQYQRLRGIAESPHSLIHTSRASLGTLHPCILSETEFA